LTVAGQDAIGGSVTVAAGTRAVSVSAVTLRLRLRLLF
ncbi:MAG: hypothetical protein RIQ88_443, partial [Actinomycetota bacterium]